tara:strand:- start:1663 stop:2106 length:444 start_codon:yes stop_codon:yes gene_type:complete
MKQSALNDCLLEIIHHEEVKTVLAITQKNLAAFAEHCEGSLNSLSILNLEHLDNNAVEPKDLCIILDDISISKTQIGLIKNTLAQKILIVQRNIPDNQNFLELGFILYAEINSARIYSYNLKTYNTKRGWNNSEGWANPENFEKYRW